MDYIKHNVEEHNKYKGIMDQIKEASGKKKEDLFIDLYSSLYGHHHAEEEIIYPAVLGEIEDDEEKEVVLEMIEEHSLLNYQFSVVGKTFLDNETWDAKFSVLTEVVEHHMDEEESDFAEIAKKHLSQEKLEELLDPFEEVLEELKAEKEAELRR